MKRVLVIVMVFGLVALIAGCSKEKAPQVKDESASEKFETASNESGITKEPTKKISSGKEEVIDLGKDVKLEMVLIPAGKFVMGSPASEGRVIDETQHEVTITKPYYMGKYEVTGEQWKSVMGINSNRNIGAKLPITAVSWKDCQEFIKKLNAITKGGYRLPYEGEWEYACRAGTNTAYSFGDKITPKDANYEGSEINDLVTVGSFKPNAFGLYDMHGNVSEWCEDWEADYLKGAVIDPKGPANGEFRVYRGGSFVSKGAGACSSSRDGRPPTSASNGIGLRLVRTP